MKDLSFIWIFYAKDKLLLVILSIRTEPESGFLGNAIDNRQELILTKIWYIAHLHGDFYFLCIKNQKINVPLESTISSMDHNVCGPLRKSLTKQVPSKIHK